jgi:hypothetical protein
VVPYPLEENGVKQEQRSISPQREEQERIFTTETQRTLRRARARAKEIEGYLNLYSFAFQFSSLSMPSATDFKEAVAKGVLTSNLGLVLGPSVGASLCPSKGKC